MNMSSAKKCISDLQQQLLIADSRCGSLKSQLDYMKMLYHDIRPETEPDRQTLDTVQSSLELLSPEPVAQMQILDAEAVESDETTRYNFLERILDIQRASKEDSEESKRSPRLSSRSQNASSIVGTRHVGEEPTTSSDNEKNKETGLTAMTPRTYIFPQNNRVLSRTVSPTREEDALLRGQLSNREKHAALYSPKIQETVPPFKESLEHLVSEDQNAYLFQELSSIKENMQRREMLLNITGGPRNGQATKRKNTTRNERKERISSSLCRKKSSSCRLDDIVSLKVKRRKGKMRSSNSRSTVATKDTNLAGRKEAKRRRQRNLMGDRQSNVPKLEQSYGDVVEIYHNIAAKSASNSVILPNKHVKLRQTSQISKPHTDADAQQKTPVRSKYERIHVNASNDRQADPLIEPRELLQRKKKMEVSNAITCDQEFKSERVSSVCANKCNSQQCQHSNAEGPYYDSMVPHNYEMPTLASKLKRANRSYFSRFNFRNIPFVVGTSVTPSHNLGLNIQQVLSIMKTRQPTVNGITPLLIRKVSTGMKPVSILMEQINDRYAKELDVDSRMISVSHQRVDSSPRDAMKNENVTPKYNRRVQNDTKHYQSVQQIVTNEKDEIRNSNKDKDTISENQLGRYRRNDCATMLSKNSNGVTMLKPFASQQHIENHMKVSGTLSRLHQETLRNGDFYDTMGHQQSPKGIREVLINLHDQFEEMNTRYEKLQSKAEKSSDKTFDKEISSLEKELNAKEEEINAVVGLYKEVMALKQQMKLLQEKSSFVCISTEVSMNPNKAYSSVPLSLGKSYATNFRPEFHRRRGRSVASTREPSASIRLAGLLRQIQTFQKQLKHTS